MKLCHSQTSPFVRKVKLAAHVLGFADELELVETNTMDTNDPIRLVNPLGKIPVLKDGSNIFYDSRVIVEYPTPNLVAASLFRRWVRRGLKH